MKKIINSILSIIIYLLAALIFFVIGSVMLIIIFFFPRLITKLVVPFCKLMITAFGCRVKIFGDFPKNETFVIMANHVSFLDVFAVPCSFATNKKFSAVAASKNFKIPIYATFLKKLNVISIDRSNREQSIKGIQQAEKVLKDDYHITILPEGTRTPTGELGTFKKGGFHLAVNTKANILPIVTKGLFKIKPINSWIIKPGLIEVHIKKPIITKDKTVNELLEETRNVFLKTLNN